MSHADSLYECKMCGGELPYTKANLCVDCKVKMLKETWECHCGCKKLFKRWNLSHCGNIRERKFIERHQNTNVGSKNFVCSVCDRGFSDAKSFYRHIDKERCPDKKAIKKFKENWNKQCHCGCGANTKPGRRGLVNHHADEPWNKNLTKYDDPRLMECSERRIREMIEEPNKSGKWMHSTSIEIKVKEYLEKLDIKFYHQYSFFYKYVVDFAVPDIKLVIECDGNYWHNFPHGTARDKEMEEFIELKGWEIIRLWESDINDSWKVCKRKLIKAVTSPMLENLQKEIK